MTFTDPIIGGESKLIRNAIQSPDYVTGVSGWTINRDGTAEFNNGTFRGTLSIRNPTTGRGFVLSPSSGDLEMYPQNSTVGLNVLPATLQNTLLDVVGVGQFLSSWRSGSVNFQDSARIRLDSESADGTSSPATVWLDAARILIGGNMAHTDGMKYLRGQRGTTPITFAANISVLVPFVFPTAFPAGTVPNVHVNINSTAGVTRYWTAKAVSITNTGFTFWFATSDAAQAAQAWAAVDVQWTAFID